MKRGTLIDQIKKKKSFLCVGLDVDLDKIPPHLLQEKNPLLAFNKEIIAATKDICVAYKPNIAFYEAYGQMGWEALEGTIDLIPEEIFTIADAKRGDIGNTAERYAEAFFKKMNFDAITLNPYMGKDCVAPFLAYEDKWAIVLGLTSNKGSEDFQMMEDENGEALFERVIRISSGWGNPSNTMFVVGATQTEHIERIRKISPKHFYLVPGVGAQGGDLNEVCRYGKNDDIGLLVNSTRGIIYQSKGKDFAEKARSAAIALQQEMADHI